MLKMPPVGSAMLPPSSDVSWRDGVLQHSQGIVHATATSGGVGIGCGCTGRPPVHHQQPASTPPDVGFFCPAMPFCPCGPAYDPA